MQLEGIASEAFWSSVCPTMPMGEPEAIPQTLGGHEHAQEQTPWSADCTTSLCCSDVAGIDNEFNWLQSNCSASSNNANGFVDTTTSFQDYCSLPMDLCATQEQFNEAFGVTPSPRLRPDEFVSQTNKRRSSTQTGGGQMAGPKKKARSSVSVSINSNKAQRTMKKTSNERSSSCCSSEIELNASETTPKGSKKGSAIGAQCLYARKRRERINERLRILQNLVPNGTKVDIGTMLEEAGHYVKFLHLQIKLLSSDELWMYAPIAYNAMNI